MLFDAVYPKLCASHLAHRASNNLFTSEGTDDEDEDNWAHQGETENSGDLKLSSPGTP